jgi:signal transduction histidine kinase
LSEAYRQETRITKEQKLQVEKIDGGGLIRITTATAYLVAFLLSVFPTGAYFYVARADLRSTVETQADTGAKSASIIALTGNAISSPRDIDFKPLLSRGHQESTQESRRIYDTSGTLVTESGSVSGLWSISARSPIYGSHGVIGEFEVVRPLSEIWGNLLGITIISIWFATWSFLILRILPNRALQNALKEALDSSEVAQRAMLARDKAQEAARLRSVFLANMSHELRTPVNGVLGMIDLVADTDLDPEQQEYINLAGSSGRHLLTIINDILDFSKLEEGRIEIVSATVVLEELLNQIIQVFRPDCQKKGLLINSDFDPVVPNIVKTDPLRIRQILVNLIGNAVRFTKAGKVSVAVRKEQTGEQSYIEFVITDTGIGVASEQLSYIFQPFTQVDESTTRAHGGAGLGLAISHQLAVSMGGNLWATSELGHGSIFHFTVPMVAAE